MRTLLKGGKVVNVFTDEVEAVNVLIENERVIGIGDYSEADVIEDITGKYVCPAFIDSHFHVESTMLTPYNLSKAIIPHGTQAVIADPHEIVNVCGKSGLLYMLQASETAPMDFYYMLPSCVRVTDYDETGAEFDLADIKECYEWDHVLGLAEVMNYPDVINGEKRVHEKLDFARDMIMPVDGHAPLLRGRGLDKYIACGIGDDHESTSFEEAFEKMRKGQWVMVRQGTAARNLSALIDFFDEPYSHRAMLATDDKEAVDILDNGHIDAVIREAVKMGKSAVAGIRMASLQAAERFGIREIGAVAPGYYANILVLNDLDTVDVSDVYYRGRCVCKDKVMSDVPVPAVDKGLDKLVHDTMHIRKMTEEDFNIEIEGSRARVINLYNGQIITGITVEAISSDNNGIDLDRDILKIAVCERHGKSGNVGLGYVHGLGLKKGAIATSVSHDSHNLVVAGTNDKDIADAVNAVAEMEGGFCYVHDGNVIGVPLPVGGLMSDLEPEELVEQIRKLSVAAEKDGLKEATEQIMRLAFTALTCIPEIRLCTFGLFDVNQMKLVPLFVN